MEIKEKNVIIIESFFNKNDAMKFMAKEFEKRNWVKDGYLKSLIARDQQSSVAIGSYLALIHGQISDMNLIVNEGVLICKLEKEMLWDEEPVLWIIGLVLKENNQIDFLAKIATVFADENNSKNLWKKTNSKDEIAKIFTNLI